ncbi:MAG: DNA-directed RNA polymerase subunit alpha [Candidatus Omnitrophica bacterium]|nr:DNA-directed RNA polymerase subunit alpha [Candidatus Omnitrophota bacterium]
MPKQLICEEATLTPTYGKFIAEPFERGYGVTIGNGFRRILISSIEGAAVTSIKVDGAHHEFATLPGVAEDLTQVVLNVKQLVLRSHTRRAKTLTIDKEKKGDITAKDIECDETIEIINPGLKIATLTKNTKFHMELEVGRGRGYVPAEKNKKEGKAIGVIPVDSLFSPVMRVNFKVEDTRVGQITDYDRLIVEIWTNGAVSPTDAMLYASNIYQRHLDIFVNFGKLPEEPEEEPVADESMYDKLRTPVSELELSVRSANCLREAKIQTIGDLVQKTPAEMLEYRNFGKKSLAEIEEILTGMGLTLGMKLDLDRLKAKSASASS